MSELEEDVSLWLSAGGTAAQARDSFLQRHGPEAGERRFRRAAAAVAYLKQNHEALRSAGLLALGEKPGDVRLEKTFAAELQAAIDAELG